jgi:carbon storage regulator
MLVLSRKSQESITIGGNIKVRIISIRGNTVRLGIEAPQEVSIVRSELADKPRPAQVYEFRFAPGTTTNLTATNLTVTDLSAANCVASDFRV